jgi:hypothetical protein
MQIKTNLKAGQSCDSAIQNVCICGMNNPQLHKEYPQLDSLCGTFLAK